MDKMREIEKPTDVADRIVSRFPWTSNVRFEGRLVGQQHVVANAIVDALVERDAQWQALLQQSYKAGAEEMRGACKRKIMVMTQPGEMAPASYFVDAIDLIPAPPLPLKD